MQTDRSGQPFVEFPMSEKEQVRVTYVADPSWTDEPTIRIQKRDWSGRTVYGPEFPATKVLDLIAAVSQLVREAKAEPAP